MWMTEINLGETVTNLKRSKYMAKGKMTMAELKKLTRHLARRTGAGAVNAADFTSGGILPSRTHIKTGSGNYTLLQV
jgi:hypothetical protein